MAQAVILKVSFALTRLKKWSTYNQAKVIFGARAREGTETVNTDVVKGMLGEDELKLISWGAGILNLALRRIAI